MLVALCLVVFWGTFFPLISEAVTGTESSVGPPWFNRVVTPLALALVALMTIGPMVAWRRVTPGGAAARAGARRWRSPSLVGVVLALATNAADSLPVAAHVLPRGASCSAWWSRSSRAAPRRGG